MEKEFSFKELEQVAIKATYPIEIHGRQIEEGENIAVFDKIIMAVFSEDKSFVSANGGLDNRAHVIWESTKDLRLRFSQGVFNLEQFALMQNARLLSEINKTFLIDQHESMESDENGYLTLKYSPVGKIFVYKVATGEKIAFTKIDDKVLQIDTHYTDVIVDYQFEYKDQIESFMIGTPLLTGFVSLTGRTREQDDITGQVRTGIVTIPKLRLMSSLNLSLGEKATPIVGNFNAIACPVGGKNDSMVVEFTFLNDDIESDIS